MLRPFLILLFVAATAVAAPVPKDGEKNTLYLPTKVGDIRVYEVTVDDRPAFELTETITKAEPKDGKTTVTVEAVDGSGRSKPPTNVFEVSGKGLFRTSNREKEGGPLPLLKLGLKAGEAWTADLAGPGGGGKATYMLGREEELKVPAGTYKAIRVDAEFKFPARTAKTAYWYAAGVGLIRLEADTSGVKQTTILKSFTPGK